MLLPQQRARNSEQEARAPKDQRDEHLADRVVQNADIGQWPLPLLPPAPMSRRAAAGTGGGAEFGAGLARVGRLEDLAAAARAGVVERGFLGAGAVGTIGQGFRAVHFIEMGFVDS